MDSVTALPGARELLAALTDAGVHWAIATSGYAATARPALALLGLPEDTPMVTRDLVRHAKPDPDLFLAAAAELGVEPRYAMVVGDSVWDLLAARRAGALGVGLMSGGYGREELERAGAYRVYADPAEMLEPHRRARRPRHRGERRDAPRVAWPGGDSRDGGWWRSGVAFTAAELLFVSPRMGLSWDEAVYVSQVSGHAPAAWFDPARARGIPLLVAPVAALTGSVAALRVYLSVVCGLGLTVALWTWRRLRPAWVLGLAGVVFGGLWVAQYYGPQAMPDMWSALGGLAAVGCFLRWVRSGGSWSLGGLGASVAFVTLVRPGDAVYLAAPLAVAAIVVWRAAGGRSRWSRPAWLAGGAEWVAEAYARFGGIGARLQAAGAEQGGFGLHFALPDELRALNGPTLCRPCTVGVRYPELDLWWFLLPVLVALAVLAARHAAGARAG